MVKGVWEFLRGGDRLLRGKVCDGRVRVEMFRGNWERGGGGGKLQKKHSQLMLINSYFNQALTCLEFYFIAFFNTTNTHLD